MKQNTEADFFLRENSNQTSLRRNKCSFAMTSTLNLNTKTSLINLMKIDLIYFKNIFSIVIQSIFISIWHVHLKKHYKVASNSIKLIFHLLYHVYISLKFENKKINTQRIGQN